MSKDFVQGFDPEEIHYEPVRGCSGGVDVESHNFDMSLDCARKLKNTDFPPNFLFGQREGTRLIDRLLDLSDPLIPAEYKGVDFIHYFSTADQVVNRFYIVANNTTEGILYSKEGLLNSVPLRTGLNLNGRTFAANYNDLCHMVNGYDKPWVVKDNHVATGWKNTPVTFWRDAGLPAPDISGVTTSIVNVEGSLVVDKYYKYRITQGILVSPSNVESNPGTIAGDMSFVTSPKITVFKSGDILHVTDPGGGKIRIESTGHDLSVDDSITISGTTSYDGDYEVDNIFSADKFDVTKTYVADETGTWKTTASKSVKLSSLPIPAATSPVNKFYIFRTVELDAATDEGIFYFLKELDRTIDAADWAAKEWTDDGSLELDYTLFAPTNHDPPPKGARFIFSYLNQMIYLAPTDYLSSLYYSKIGEPEHVYTLPLVLDNNNGSGLTGGFVDSLGNCIIFKEHMAYQLYRLGIGASDRFDWRPIPSSVGCIAPRTIVNTPYGVVFFSRYDWYIWDGSVFKKLRNRHGKSMRAIFKNIPQGYLRKACATYDIARDRILLCYHNPSIDVRYFDGSSPLGENNCCVVYDFEHAAGPASRFIWPWVGINASCFANVTNSEGYGVIWYANSVNGRICQLNADFNFDEYVYGATTTWGPSTVSVLADPANLDDCVFGGQLFYELEMATRTEVEIDAEGTPDTFKWKQYQIDQITGEQIGVDLYSGADVAITGNEQVLANGITVRFNATTGHTLADKWVLTQIMVAGAWGKQLTGAFTGIADNGDGTVTVTSSTNFQSDPNNKLLAGSYVILSGSDYDGYYQVLSVPTLYTFVITAAFVATSTGSWKTEYPAQWDSGSGNQIEWEVELRESAPPIEATRDSRRIDNTHFIIKQMDQMFGDLHPMPNNELEISVWDRSMNFLCAYQPIFKQIGGFGIDKYDIARFDTILSERLKWDLPGACQATAFQIRFKYPRSGIGGWDWSTTPPTPIKKTKIFGCRPKVKYLTFSYYNRFIQGTTTEEALIR